MPATILRPRVPIARVAILLLLGHLTIAVPEAAGVQASGFVQILPEDWGSLSLDRQIDVAIRVINRSSDSPAADFPADGVDPVPSRLTGRVSIVVGCLDGHCVSRDDSLVFVPAGDNGCVVSAASVLSCDTREDGGIDIVMSPTDVPAGAAAEVATIRLRVQHSPLFSQIGVRASVDRSDWVACSSSAPAACASAGLHGATQLRLVNAPGELKGCPGSCPSKIRFHDGVDRPDLLEVHALATIPGLDAVYGGAFAVRLSNESFGTILETELPTGTLVRQGDTYRYDDPNARTDGGIEHLKISRVDGTTDRYRFDMRAFATLSSATESVMTVMLGLGEASLTTSAAWTAKPFGWQVDLPR